MESVRIDSWLWAARFFKTRTLAKNAIEGGKIHIDGNRTKASKAVQSGQTVTISKGTEHFEVVVRGLSNKRGPAKVAQTLYEETTESVAKREMNSEQRKLARAAAAAPDHKPSKKERRDIQRFKRDNLE
ncbi:MAG: tRNA synthetase RNA-binding protein [Alcanivorax borkumensis]|jgi:ribosome-associated heat shock protein Hsp15|uniref:Heat shock protein 15 n=1 Tax=Alcanivorax borkumensis (strain ATCC 700651 / DSM 11573 / NCIMB 13689 / SK2) TaxID=393595 RepID=Q0VSX3_ALCBS|nr:MULTISPECIES: S4 domain-containing protein [Alcanivorax]OJH08172.1 MAG: tRNA synthetase RNA-binding protein [Alcanivorax borkumensis]BAP13137.1 heat shock protein 15 kDa [Alcanivorax sp. NBRC 101098]CAL15725.1 heat shock protein 15 kDa [Alcanivorax borkumensis SK2]